MKMVLWSTCDRIINMHVLAQTTMGVARVVNAHNRTHKYHKIHFGWKGVESQEVISQAKEETCGTMKIRPKRLIIKGSN